MGVKKSVFPMLISLESLDISVARNAGRNYTIFGRKLDYVPQSVVFVIWCKSVQ